MSVGVRVRDVTLGTLVSVLGAWLAHLAGCENAHVEGREAQQAGEKHAVGDLERLSARDQEISTCDFEHSRARARSCEASTGCDSCDFFAEIHGL